ncbi:uncharacterized protein LOC130982061 [Arachis stenosperma]|uniref:uncharacterized protein LOC130982061 n=1 Tax=Arachis stenosperma TaxID=217475 RepID=UPI0025AC7239|nr:uncharacterized protein LOC130982061 [Arachis stenosperma]
MKTIEDAIDVIETLADNEYFYASERNNNRGAMELNNMDAILAQNKMITKQLAELTKQMEKNQAAAIHTQPSPQSEPNTEEGVNWEEVNYLGNSSRGFCDSGASINVMPLSFMKKLQINELKPTNVVIQLADKTQKQTEGILENVLVRVGNYFLPTDFVVLDMEESHIHPIILGRPFLATARAIIDVEQGELILRIHNEHLTFHVFKPATNSESEPKELENDQSKALLEESDSEPKPEPLKQSLVNKQEFQETQQPKELKEELKPQKLRGAVNKDCPITRVNGATPEEEGKVRKKSPRGWRNKKILTEAFSPRDKVILAHHLPTPPNRPTIPSQLP